VAFEALKGTKTLQELARKYDLHPVQISDWKKVFAERMPHLFEKEAARGGLEEFEKERERLHAKIGELNVVVDFLQKKSKQLGL
jgi:transposase